MTPEERINEIMESFVESTMKRITELEEKRHFEEEEEFRKYNSTLIECLGLVRMLMARGLLEPADKMLVQMINYMGPLDEVK